MKRFGLTGYPLEHSFSPSIFREIFKTGHSGDCSYELFPLESPYQIKELAEGSDDICGLQVTIPFKETIIPFLDELHGSAKEAGAVNTIKIIRSSGKVFLKGYNTDTWGFEHSTNAFDNFTHALILGTGGAAKAVAAVLRKRKLEFLMVSRNPAKEGEIGYDDLDRFINGKFKWIINATPAGMYPNTGDYPAIPYHLLTHNHFLYDLIYNPEETVFLSRGKMAGANTMNGLRMLHLQAEKSWEIWITE